MNANTIHVEFDLPGTVVTQAGMDRKNISREVQRMLALFLYEHHKISLGKACELGGISQWEFAERNRGLGITLAYSTEDLTDDMERLSDV